MCVINVSSQRLEVNAMHFGLGRIIVVILNLTLVSIICMILSEFYGVIIFRNGGYTEWSTFSECTVSCGGGSMQRSRECSNPFPSFGGYNCSRLGPANEVEVCNDRGCPINGGFERWSMFRDCSKSCGGGVQKRIRYCIDPIPRFNGLDCAAQGLGPYEEERECNTQLCHIDGGFTEWTQWTECTKTCNGGRTGRERSCTNPSPAFGGNDCTAIGAATESVACNEGGCPQNGVYGEWTHWGQCTAGCGGGFHVRTRACDSPPPTGGGKTCYEMGYGNSEDVKPCGTKPCKKKGGYSNWSIWSKCTKTCGGGRTERKRTCDNPAPAGNGKTCKEQGLGASIEADECNTQAC